MGRRRRITQIFEPALTVDFAATNNMRLVYLLVANKPFWHGKDYTRVVYIGTTGRGISRIAGSASVRIKQVSDQGTVPGLRRLDAFVVIATGKRGPQTIRGRTYWSILERELLLRFRTRYGEPPPLNGTGHGMQERGEFDVFARKTIDRIISRYT